MMKIASGCIVDRGMFLDVVWGFLRPHPCLPAFMAILVADIVVIIRITVVIVIILRFVAFLARTDALA